MWDKAISSHTFFFIRYLWELVSTTAYPNMKKFIFLISVLLCYSFNSSAQIKFCAYFDGFWSPWTASADAKVYGNYEGFIIYTDSEGPWDYRFKFTIDDFKVPNKKQRKKDIKAKRSYVFSGTVEYYVSDIYPSAISAFRENKGPQR